MFLYLLHGCILVFTFTDIPGHAQTGPRFVIMSPRCLDDSVLMDGLGSKMISLAMLFSEHEECRVSLCTL